MTVTTARVPAEIGGSIPRPHRARGTWFAVVGALGQAAGLVLSRYGAPSYDPFGATQIRTIAGVVGFAVLFAATGRWRRIGTSLRDRRAVRHIVRGSFFGPFLGVSLGLLAAQRAGTGVASTIIATVPVLLIPVSIVVFHEKVTFREALGAIVAVMGVALLFLA
jgi:drug/metabolite transporter (DMT)-like permease